MPPKVAFTGEEESDFALHSTKVIGRKGHRGRGRPPGWTEDKYARYVIWRRREHNKQRREATQPAAGCYQGSPDLSPEENLEREYRWHRNNVRGRIGNACKWPADWSPDKVQGYRKWKSVEYSREKRAAPWTAPPPRASLLPGPSADEDREFRWHRESMRGRVGSACRLPADWSAEKVQRYQKWRNAEYVRERREAARAAPPPGDVPWVWVYERAEPRETMENHIITQINSC